MENDELLRNITLLFLEHGYKKLTMAQMAKELGVSTKRLHHIYHTKENLIKQVLALRVELFIGMSKEMRETTPNAIENFIHFRKKVNSIVSEYQQRVNILELKSVSIKLYRKAIKDLMIMNSVCFEMIHRRGLQEKIFTDSFSSQEIGEIYADFFLFSRLGKYESIPAYTDKVNLGTQIFFRGILTEKGLKMFEKYEQEFDVK